MSHLSEARAIAELLTAVSDNSLRNKLATALAAKDAELAERDQMIAHLQNEITLVKKRAEAQLAEANKALEEAAMSDLVDGLIALADLDARAGEPLGICMREAAAVIVKLREALHHGDGPTIRYNGTGEDALRNTPSDAARDVLVERQRQIEGEGWTLEHDDTHHEVELAWAAAAYALGVAELGGAVRDGKHSLPWRKKVWPWDRKWWKPSDRRRNLEKAGALILAAIDQLDRAARRAREAQGGENG